MELLRATLVKLLEQAAVRAQQAGDLPTLSLPEIVIERPANAGYGDYACTLPLKLARGARMNPLEIANRLARHLEPTPMVQAATPAAPGFINITLNPRWLADQVETIQREGAA